MTPPQHPNPMRITFVLPFAGLAGGVRTVAIYADRLRRRGHHVTVVSTSLGEYELKHRIKSLLKGRGWPTMPKNLPSHLDGLGIEHRKLPTAGPVAGADVPDADVVVATWWETAEWVHTFPAAKGAKAYFLQHHEVVFPHQPAARVEATWGLPMHKIICSQWLVDLSRDKYGDALTSYVPYAVDAGQFDAPPRGKQPAPTVGVMYSVVGFKGCDVSLEAFRRAKQNVPGLRLVAFGDVPEAAELPLPAGTRYAYQPGQDQIKGFYAGCDAWLFGSRCEGFGLPLLEAMACRTPVIATPTGAAPELVAQGGGWLVKSEDPADMAAAIERVCAMTDEDWRRASDRAHAAATGYTWDDATDLFESALRRAIEREQRGDLSRQAAGARSHSRP